MKDYNNSYIHNLIKKFQKGDKQVFNKLIPIYQNYIYRIALKYLRSREDAEDLTQEIFIKLYNNLKSFKFKSNFKTYLYRIAVNSACNYYKKTKRDLARIDTIPKNEEKIISRAVNIDDKIIEKEIISDLEKAILDLTEKHKTIINLKDFQNLTYKQISKKLHITENAAKIRHHYALKKLKKNFLK